MDRKGRNARIAQGVIGAETSRINKTRRLKELTRLTCLKEFKGVIEQRGRDTQTHETDAGDETHETDAGDGRTRQTQETDAGDRRRRRDAGDRRRRRTQEIDERDETQETDAGDGRRR